MSDTTTKPQEPRSGHWSVIRHDHLKDHPACAACGTREHLEVHHVIPFHWPGGHELELNRGNLITLCESPSHNCHLYVGHLGDWKSRNADVTADAASFLAKIKGRPYPPKEPDDGSTL